MISLALLGPDACSWFLMLPAGPALPTTSEIWNLGWGRRARGKGLGCPLSIPAAPSPAVLHMSPGVLELSGGAGGVPSCLKGGAEEGEESDMSAFSGRSQQSWDRTLGLLTCSQS